MSEQSPSVEPNYKPLPISWVDRIFLRLFARFGKAWAALYPDVNEQQMALIKQEWAYELAG
jgi:hypothetical protein